jgi:hypothetical protein
MDALDFVNNTLLVDAQKLNDGADIVNETAADLLKGANLNVDRAQLQLTAAEDAVEASKEADTQAKKEAAADQADATVDAAEMVSDQAIEVSFNLYLKEKCLS